MTKSGITMIIIIVILFLLWELVSFIGIPVKTTSNGEHTGYVSAIEDNGVFFKGITVYFKTNPMSSQEDKYCLYIDNIDLRKKLEQASENQEKITITFDSYFIISEIKCNGENAVITGIK